MAALAAAARGRCIVAIAEAIRNAFRHAEARGIEVQIIYTASRLRVRIRDDGKAIDPTILDHGRSPGRWGLSGMRERAAPIGAAFDIWSRPRTGTEVELSTPASVAHASHRADSTSR
jgi:signal transduction histidine kinase